MSADDDLYLDHISESIDRIDVYVAGGRESFLAPGIVQDAVLRRLHTLAESVQHLSPALKARHPHIPWREIVGFRHRIVHDYLSSFDLNLAWTFIEEDLPVLRGVVEAELER